MLSLQEQKIVELQDFMSVSQDLAIEDFAGRALPIIEKHRDMLQKIPGVKAGPTEKATI